MVNHNCIINIGEVHGCNMDSFDAGRWTKVCSGMSVIMTRRDAGNTSEHNPLNCIDRSKHRREF